MILGRGRLVWRFLPFLLAGLLIIACYLYFFVDVQGMISLLRSVDPFYYSLAVLVLLLDTVFFSLAWHSLLSLLSIKAAFRKTLLFVWAAAFVDILIPAESVTGDISKAYMMSKETGGTERNTGKIAASLVSHRMVNTVVALGSLLVGCLFFILRHEIPRDPVLGMSVSNWILLVTVGSAVTLAFMFILTLNEGLTQKTVDSLFKLATFVSKDHWPLKRFKSRVRKGLNAFHYAITVIGGQPTRLATPVVFSLIYWFFSLLISSLVFMSLGHPVHFGIVVIVYSLGCTIQSIPLGIPAEVGLTEIAMISLYTAFLRGTPGVIDVGALSAAATFLTRILTVGLRLFIGFVAIQWVGAKALMGDSS